ncbi:hypothetical protein FraQA3DRAFT_2567 [Frankia sp. QA3]|nr:hypothetical protein FraQA3DRAFT_2567 [Frankia sp. QA3]
MVASGHTGRDGPSGVASRVVVAVGSCRGGPRGRPAVVGPREAFPCGISMLCCRSDRARGRRTPPAGPRLRRGVAPEGAPGPVRHGVGSAVDQSARPVRAVPQRSVRRAPTPGTGSGTVRVRGDGVIEGAVGVQAGTGKERRYRGLAGPMGGGTGGCERRITQRGRQQAEARIPKSTNRRRVSIRGGAVMRAGRRARTGTSPPAFPPRFPDMFVRMMGNCCAVQRLSAIAPIGIRHRSNDARHRR